MQVVSHPAYGASTAVQAAGVHPAYGVLASLVHAGTVHPGYGVSTAVHKCAVHPMYGLTAVQSGTWHLQRRREPPADDEHVESLVGKMHVPGLPEEEVVGLVLLPFPV